MYTLLPYDLTNGLDEKVQLAGGFIYISRATDSAVNVDVRLDRTNADKVNLVKGEGLVMRFDRVYLSAPAQAGKSVTILLTDSFDSRFVRE